MSLCPFLLSRAYADGNIDRCYREKEKENKARRAIRSSNFTQQTNALDVDKHMSDILVSFSSNHLLIYSIGAQDGLYRRKHEAPAHD